MKLTAAIASAAFLLATSAMSTERGAAEANGLSVTAAYAVVAGPSAPTAAVYMTIANATETADRLVAVETPAARRTELHMSELQDGIARMVALPDGVPVPAGETVTLAPRGLHVMLMGLTAPLQPGADVPLTLVFETAGRVPLSVALQPAGGHAGH